MITRDEESSVKPKQSSAITSGIDLGLDPVPEWELPELAETMAPVAVEDSSKALDATQEMITGLRTKNESWLKGEISGDVADQLRSQAALSARTGGAGVDSPMARNLQARDFGTTSMQIQQQGMQQESGIVQMQHGLSQLREHRAQFQQQALEQSRQFGASLEQDALRTQLAHRELLLKQDAFNAEQNMKLIELISNVTMMQTSQQLTAAQFDISDSAITGTFNNLQKQLQTLSKQAGGR